MPWKCAESSTRYRPGRDQHLVTNDTRRNSGALMRLTERIHLVGSGSSGLYLTDAYDAHAFLVIGDRERC